MRYYFDCETTGKNPYACELITGYLLSEDGRNHLIESQVNEWSFEAEEIHKISYGQMRTFHYKATAWDYVLDFLQGEVDVELIVYANPQTELGYLLFDIVVFKMHLMTHLGVGKESNFPFKVTGTSVYSLARDTERKGLYEAYVKPETNRKSYTQENVYYALFGERYSAHDAKNDVVAMKRIYEKLIELNETGIANSGQMLLI